MSFFVEEFSVAAATNVVNLDALISRQVLSAPSEEAEEIRGLTIMMLKSGMIYQGLRKPDFQRETANWNPEQVVDLISTFVAGQLIPAIILWQTGARVFVIDGAHRLSALLAWVHDDYGAGSISRVFYGDSITDKQVENHNVTKQIVDAAIGTFSQHEKASENPAGAPLEIVARAHRIGWRDIPVQMIRNADAEKAEDAFFRINQGGTVIDKTERRILRARRSAVALAPRAIVRQGTGHNFWEKFKPATQQRIKKLGADIAATLFEPPLKTPVKTLDIPIAGHDYGAQVLPFCFDLVAMINNVNVPDSSSKTMKEEDLPDDVDGANTATYLNKVLKVTRMLCSNHASSLGLHPALYFYNDRGEFSPASFLNVAFWFLSLDDNKKLPEFLTVRAKFEALLINHPSIRRNPSNLLGSGTRTRPRMLLLYDTIFAALVTGKSNRAVWQSLIVDSRFSFLQTPADNEDNNSANKGTRFSSKAKTAGFFTETLPSAPKCPLCGGLRHINGITMDHKRRKREGGRGKATNAQPAHPLCNSLKG